VGGYSIVYNLQKTSAPNATTAKDEYTNKQTNKQTNKNKARWNPNKINYK